MSTVILPTVGRIVHFFSRHPNDAKPGPLAAIVTAVNSPSSVNLCVFSRAGEPMARTNVPLVQQGETADPAQHYCEWMEYQIGQAKKYEDLAKQRNAADAAAQLASEE